MYVWNESSFEGTARTSVLSYALYEKFCDTKQNNHVVTSVKDKTEMLRWRWLVILSHRHKILQLKKLTTNLLSRVILSYNATKIFELLKNKKRFIMKFTFRFNG